MMRTLLTTTLSALCLMSLGQARFVMNNDAYVVFRPTANPGSYLVIENSNTNGITRLGTGGNIVSEREENKVRWQISNGTGAYHVPFTTAGGTKTPVVLEITTSPGSVGGSIVFSTYNHTTGAAPAWDNRNYMPSDVTHMNIWATGAIHNSEWVIDRFWVIDAAEAPYAYATKPGVSIALNYDPADITAGNAGQGGIAPGANLGGQRFNTGTGTWGDYLPDGASGVNQVTGINAPSVDFFRSWTLVEQANPLPIELVAFDARCTDDRVTVTWTTATELDNDFFTVEKSTDGEIFDAIGTLQGAGQSQAEINYTFVDERPSELAYYRLTQTDFDGTATTSNVVVAGCQLGDGVQIVNAWDDGSNVHLMVSSTQEHEFDLALLDGHGKIMHAVAKQVVNRGMTELIIPKHNIATGMYMLRLQNNTELLSRRIVLR